MTVTGVDPSPSPMLDGLADRFTAGAASSSTIVPVAVSVCVTGTEVPETFRFTVNVSSGSTAPSSVVATVKVCVSPAVPAKVRAAVFSV